MTSHTDTAEFMDELRSALAEDNERHVDNHTPATSGDVRSAIASGDGASLARYLAELGNDALMTDDASAYLHAYLCHPANAAWAARTAAPHIHLSTWGVPHHDPTISHAWRHPLRVSLGDVNLATFTVKANAWRRYSGLVPRAHRVYFAAGRHKLTSPTPINDLVRKWIALEFKRALADPVMRHFMCCASRGDDEYIKSCQMEDYLSTIYDAIRYLEGAISPKTVLSVPECYTSDVERARAIRTVGGGLPATAPRLLTILELVIRLRTVAVIGSRAAEAMSELISTVLYIPPSWDPRWGDWMGAELRLAHALLTDYIGQLTGGAEPLYQRTKPAQEAP